MKKKTFLIFTLPSFIMMVFFIAIPLLTVFVQSFQFDQEILETKEQEQCDPFGCKTEIVTVPLLDDNGNTIKKKVWVGFKNYQNLLKFDQVKKIFLTEGVIWKKIKNIEFYKALRFTLTFTFITLPFILIIGLILALCVNNVTQRLRGSIIFIILLPFIITPIIGSLSIKWLFIGDGIITAFLEWLNDTNYSFFADGNSIEILMIFYRIWHTTPFSFIIFYAALQTVDRERIEAAIVDGANRFERLRFIIIPHILPLITFVTLIHLMDAYRVFDEIVGFNAASYRISLQWLTFDYLSLDLGGNRFIGRASATSVLTMIGIIVILSPVLRQTWKDQKARRI